MMKIKGLIFSLSVLIFISCTSNDALRTEDGMTVIALLDVKEEDNDYAIQKIVPLETTSDNLMGMYLRIKIAGDELFVLDEDIKDAVHRFDVSGKYKGAVAQSGEGPGMVNNMYDFLIDGDTLEVLTGKGSHSEIVKVSLTDGGSRSLPLDLIGDSFEKLDNGNYIIYAGYNLPHVTHRLVEINPAGVEVKRDFENDYKNEMLPMIERNFQKVGADVFFKEAFNPVTYRIGSDTIEPRFEFDFGNYRIPSRFWEVDIMQGFKMINSSGFADIYQYYENGRYAFFEIYIQDDKGIENHQVIMDKRNNTVSRRVFPKNENSIFYQSAGFTGENELMFVAPASFLKDYADKKDLDAHVQPVVGNMDRENNPVLVYVKIDG